ncbi:putative deoxyribonuclease tatdn3-A [Cariama cristata]
MGNCCVHVLFAGAAPEHDPVRFNSPVMMGSAEKAVVPGAGLVGLDFTPWLVSTPQQREEQQRVLALQLATARERHLLCPGCLLHNFAGRQSVTLEEVQAGYYFSSPPAVTRLDQVKKLIKQIPLENISLETDSPSLAPKRYSEKHVD